MSGNSILRRLAKAATPGPWLADDSDVEDAFGKSVIQGYCQIACSKEDAEFIAAVNPATFLSILDELEALRSDAARWRKVRTMDRAALSAIFEKVGQNLVALDAEIDREVAREH